MSALIDQFWPYAMLCVIAFSAGTLLPFSSEVAFVAQMNAGLGSPIGLLVAATTGNVAGSCFNWWVGKYARHFEGRRWFPFSTSAIDRASARFNRLGVWTLLLAWVPIIGDPLTFVAGAMRVPFWIFLPLVTIGKAGRYAALAYGLS